MNSARPLTGRVIPRRDVEWDHTCDVLVVGSGIGGAAAAYGALAVGARPMLVEKAAAFGGTYAKSAGAVWVPGNPSLAAQGMHESPQDTLRFLARCARPVTYDPTAEHLGMDEWEYGQLEAYVRSAAPIVEALEREGAMQLFFHEHFPDYQSTNLAEAVVKRSRSGAPIGADGASLRGVGQAAHFASDLDLRGVDVRLQHEVVAVVVDEDGAVLGACVRSAAGDLFVRTTGGVVFASGGFTGQPELRAAYLPAWVLGGAALSSNTGDFVHIARELGLPLHAMADPWLAPVPLELLGHPDMCPIFVSPGDSMINLNKYGQRVMNEKAPYNEAARIFGAWDPHRLEYPNLVQVMVYDQRVYDAWGAPHELDADAKKRWALEALGDYVHDDDVVIRGADLDELACNVNARLADVRKQTGVVAQLDAGWAAQAAVSIERFNDLARAGVDDDQHRGENAVEVVWGSTRRPDAGSPNPVMHPITAEGPYYAVLLVAGTLDTRGGPRTDPDGCVLDASGASLPGLYAAGNCAASPFGQGYPAGGVPNGHAMVFGYRAGQHAGGRAR